MELAPLDLWTLLVADDAGTTSPSADLTDDEREREQARQRRARHRVKRRDELTQLRADRAALEASLSALLQPAHADQLMPTGGWRGAAVRQLRRRAKSEATNRELRAQVMRLHLAAKQLERACLALRANAPTKLIRQPRDPMRPVQVNPMDLSRLTTMAKELVAMYGLKYTVLDGCERPTTADKPCTWEVHRRWDPHQDREYVELLESRAVPFSLNEAVAAAQTALMSTLTKEHPVAIIDPKDLLGATAFKFVVLQESVYGHPVEQQCLWVGRVFSEAGRSVLCWQSVSMDCNRRGPEFHEHGWGIAQSVADESTSSNGTKFVFSTRYSMAPGVSLQPLPSEHGRLFEKFADFVTQQPDQEAADWLEAMEDAVLDGVGSLQVN